VPPCWQIAQLTARRIACEHFYSSAVIFPCLGRLEFNTLVNGDKQCRHGPVPGDIDPGLISSTCPGKLRGWAKFELCCLTLAVQGLSRRCVRITPSQHAMRDKPSTYRETDLEWSSESEWLSEIDSEEPRCRPSFRQEGKHDSSPGRRKSGSAPVNSLKRTKKRLRDARRKKLNFCPLDSLHLTDEQQHDQDLARISLAD
jgi:hypothetical protein